MNPPRLILLRRLASVSVTPTGEVEVDGAYFGGYVKPANRKEEISVD